MPLALYRKYRPRRLADLLGQEMTVEILRNASRQNRFSHGYLFYGPRGTGKTTAARLLAKLANCERRENVKNVRDEGEPCNECNACIAIDSGQSLDVIEIDAASNRNIEDVRNLRENVNLAPVTSRYKVFIVDEVHMLNTFAFNALLKTLEEPPAHVIFILATTELEKIPATIASRVQRFAFHRLPKDVIVKKLEFICHSEKIEAEKDALELIAVAAEGGLRDAESALDQITGSAPAVTLANAEAILGRAGLGKLAELGELLAARDIKAALTFIENMNEAGTASTHFTKDLVHYLRRVLSLKLNPALETLFLDDITANDISNMKRIAEKTDSEFMVRLLKALLAAYAEMRYSPFAYVPLEVAIVEALTFRANKN